MSMENIYRSEANEYDSLLISSQMDPVTDVVTAAAGQALLRGTVLGLTTDTKEAYPVDSTKSDGTEQPYAVLADDISADADPASVAVYLMAELNADALIFGSSTVNDYRQDMRKIGLIVKDAQNREVTADGN
jgi:hypothetical protein